MLLNCSEQEMTERSRGLIVVEEEVNAETQRRKDAKCWCRTLPCVRLRTSCVPFGQRSARKAGFPLRPPPFRQGVSPQPADRSRPCPVLPCWGRPRRESGCTRSVLRQEGNGRHQLAYGGRFHSAESGRSPRLPGLDTGTAELLTLRLCDFATLRFFLIGFSV